MEQRSLFISSCTRRQLARRRAFRSLFRLQLLVASAALTVALAGVILAHGGL